MPEAETKGALSFDVTGKQICMYNPQAVKRQIVLGKN